MRGGWGIALMIALCAIASWCFVLSLWALVQWLA